MKLAKKTGLLTCLFLCSVVFDGCKNDEHPNPTTENKTTDRGEIYSFEAPHMGTLFKIRVWLPKAKKDSLDQLTSLTGKAFDRVAELNQVFSDYQMDSEVSKLREASANQPFSASNDLLTILKTSQELYQLSDGSFDITIGPMVQLWRRSRKNVRLPTTEQIAMVRQRTGFDKLQIDYQAGTVTKTVDHMALDFGGIVKGYAADEALDILQKGGFPHALVAASGDIAFGEAPAGTKGWKVGLDTLEMTEVGEAGLALANTAVSTSGDTQRFVIIDEKRYSHIVDKQTGLGLTDRIAVSIIANNAIISDSYATTVSVMGLKKGLAWIESQPDVECRIVTVDTEEKTRIVYSSGFPSSNSHK